MKQTVNFYAFEQAFRSSDRANQFGGYDGLRAMFDYLEEYEESTGEELDLDVVALCCEYSRYESLGDLRRAYGEDFKTMEEVEDRTTVIRIDNSDAFIIANY